MKKINILYIASMIIMLMGCKEDYKITQHSGGKVVGYWECHCIVYYDEHYNAYSFMTGDTIIKIAGDVRFEYIKD